MSSFHPIQTPIQSGLTLLEAGAGTGKTYCLVRLVARQIVEQAIPIQAILTVTFTKAATAEIQTRLQALLHQLFRELREPTAENRLDLTTEWLSRGEDFLKLALDRLHIALCNFDRANIYTIDSFFQRLTRDFSLDCRTLSSVEIEPQSAPLIQMALRDYWRQHVYPMTADEYADFSISFHTAESFLQQRFQTPNAQLDPAYTTHLEQYQIPWDAFLSELLLRHTELTEFLANQTGCFHGGKPPFNRTKDKLLGYIQEILADPDQLNLQPDLLHLLSVHHLSLPSLLKKGASFSIEEHPLLPLFHKVTPLLSIPSQWKQCLQLGNIEAYVQQRLPQIKAEMQVQTYDDITNNLYDLLQTRNGDKIRYSCRAKYQSVSIDEFQDTSPYQCDIFLKLFHHPGGTLHIIGDPKQSIYRFRGADVFAYLNARSLADHRYELLTNHRSSQSLVQGINHIFQQSEDPFFSGQSIKFHPANAANLDTPNQIPLEVRHIEGNHEADIAQDVTAQISQLLGADWDALYQEKTGTIQANDISILVRNGHQAQNLFQALTLANIPCSIRTNTNLFQSQEAQEFRILLDALMQPHRIGPIKLALLTPALGSGTSLHQDDDELLPIMEHFTNAHETWNLRGLLPAVNQLDQALHLRRALLSLTGGERRVTNYFHLAELLDTKARKDSLYPLAITNWLEAALQGDRSDVEAETDQLRVASDAQAVQIQTIHSSKGLQFPIVFLPFTYGQVKKDGLIYHQDGQTHIAPYRDKRTSIEQRITEEKADSARLLYVALTRAESRCILHVDIPKQSSKKEIAFHEMLAKPTKEDWVNIALQSQGTLRFTTISPEEIPTTHTQRAETTGSPFFNDLHCAPSLERRPQRQHSTSSFTGLTRNLPDPKDLDPYETHHHSLNEYDQGETFWAAFQPGSSLGLVFHEFFEEADFQDTSQHEDLFKAKLDKYQPYRTNTPVPFSTVRQVAAWIPSVLTHQLHPSLPIRLADIGNYQRLNEASFLLTTHDLSLVEFANILDHSPPPYLPEGYTKKLRRMPKKQFVGFLDGIIDLIFEHGGRYHLLDWKTNQIEENTPQGLANLMAYHHYFLQYHLYSLALDALLRKRIKNYDPERHLGEIFYLFLRGVTPGQVGSGVYTDRLSPIRLARLSNKFHLEPEEEPC